MQVANINLGNGHFEKNTKLDEDKFVEREFPQLLKCSEKPHPAIFVPDAFLYKELTTKVKHDLIHK